jgi:putative sterol carrier protein
MLAEITQRIAKALGADSGLGKTMKVDFGPEGKIYIDAAHVPHFVNNEDLPADCTVKISMQDFLQLATGKLNPAVAMLQKKLQVEGDAAVAMKLGALLQKGP